MLTSLTEVKIKVKDYRYIPQTKLPDFSFKKVDEDDIPHFRNEIIDGAIKNSAVIGENTMNNALKELIQYTVLERNNLAFEIGNDSLRDKLLINLLKANGVMDVKTSKHDEMSVVLPE